MVAIQTPVAIGDIVLDTRDGHYKRVKNFDINYPFGMTIDVGRGLESSHWFDFLNDTEGTTSGNTQEDAEMA